MSEAETKAKPKGSLTKEEHRQLLVHHMSGLRVAKKDVDEAREPLKAAQEEFTALVNEAKGDLGKGYTRKYLMTLLEDATTRLRDLLSEEERRARDRAALGLPVFGVQADLFGEASAKLPTEARDEVEYEAEGFMRGRAGLLQEIPDGTPPRFHQAVMRGYEKGQQLTMEDIVAGDAIKKRMGEPDAGAAAVDLNKEEPDPTSPEAVKAAADKLVKGGFTEAKPEELNGQRPRRAIRDTKAGATSGEAVAA